MMRLPVGIQIVGRYRQDDLSVLEHRARVRAGDRIRKAQAAGRMTTLSSTAIIAKSIARDGEADEGGARQAAAAISGRGRTGLRQEATRS